MFFTSKSTSCDIIIALATVFWFTICPKNHFYLFTLILFMTLCFTYVSHKKYITEFGFIFLTVYLGFFSYLLYLLQLLIHLDLFVTSFLFLFVFWGFSPFLFTALFLMLLGFFFFPFPLLSHGLKLINSVH